MIHRIIATEEVIPALFDPSPLDHPDVIGISLHEIESVGRYRSLLFLYNTPEGCYARRGEQRTICTSDGVKPGMIWAGTIEIPKYNYDKYVGKLIRLGIFAVKDVSNGEGYLDGIMYELRAKSALSDRSATLVCPSLSGDKSLNKLIREISRLLVLPKNRFEKISRLDRFLMWLRPSKSGA